MNAHSTAPSSVSGVYAGFSWRTVALVLDSVIVNVAAFVIAFIGGVGIAVVLSGRADDLVAAGTVLGYVVGMLTNWLYFTLCESSTWQATLGKRMLSLRVTDLHGRRIGFGQANGRYWSKIISGLLLFMGFLMVGFDRKKQGLHDKLAGTLVVRVPAS